MREKGRRGGNEEEGQGGGKKSRGLVVAMSLERYVKSQ